MAEPMDYASAGVDIDLEGSAVASLIASLGGSTRKPGTPGAPVHLPGGFGGLIEFGDSLLALATPSFWVDVNVSNVPLASPIVGANTEEDNLSRKQR